MGHAFPEILNPNPTEDPREEVLVECASYVVGGMINERLYDGKTKVKAALSFNEIL